MRLRPASLDDAAAIAALYAPIVEHTGISFEDRAPGTEQMRERIAQISQRWPWVVAESQGLLIGYAYASAHRSRAAYRWSVDVTVYVDEGARGKGVGRALYGDLFERLRAQGFYNAFAGIALPNDASVALHRAFGFKLVGVYRNVGFKLDRWRDVSWWQLQLRAPQESPPPEPATVSARR